ncbi:hypothetical protein HDU97_004038 [Phlyctochytrium planicorne]|nr:hypothetical protein HDU97_004038 [Phlyctochytrium planicorne]
MAKKGKKKLQPATTTAAAPPMAAVPASTPAAPASAVDLAAVGTEPYLSKANSSTAPVTNNVPYPFPSPPASQQQQQQPQHQHQQQPLQLSPAQPSAAPHPKPPPTPTSDIFEDADEDDEDAIPPAIPFKSPQPVASQPTPSPAAVPKQQQQPSVSSSSLVSSSPKKKKGSQQAEQQPQAYFFATPAAAAASSPIVSAASSPVKTNVLVAVTEPISAPVSPKSPETGRTNKPIPPLVTIPTMETPEVPSKEDMDDDSEPEDEDHVPLAVVKERHSAQNSPATPTTPMSFASVSRDSRTVLQSPLRSAAEGKPLPKLHDQDSQQYGVGFSSFVLGDIAATINIELMRNASSCKKVETTPESWPSLKRTEEPYYSQSESEADYDSSDTSSDLGTVPRRTPRATTSSSSYSSERMGSMTSKISTEELGASGSGRPLRPKASGWFGSIYNAFQNFVDPEIPEEQLVAEINNAKAAEKGSIPVSKVPTPDEDFFEGKKLFEAKQYEKAVKQLEIAVAACNHVEAMKYLADCYTPQRLSNTSKLSEWTKRRMAVLGTPEGMLQHAKFLKLTTGKNEGEPIVLIRAAADAKHPPAMHEFGLFLREIGKGAEAMVWFHNAADEGYEISEEQIAEGYEKGIGVPMDPVAGAAWRERVNERKEEEEKERARKAREEQELALRVRAEAQRRAQEKAKLEREAKMREADAAARRALDKPLSAAVRNIEWGFYVKGIEQLHSLATQGNADARDYLDPDLSPMHIKNSQGMYYMGQHHAAHADPIAAAKWYRRSAEGGYHEAMVTYAAYLIVGKGMETSDPGQAMAWLMKSWDVGRNREAALALGEAYTKGIGVMPDPVKAVKWYTRAWDEGGYAEAAFAVGLAYATGFTPGAVDPTQWSQASYGGNQKVSESLDARTVVKQSDNNAAELEQEKTGSPKPKRKSKKDKEKAKEAAVEQPAPIEEDDDDDAVPSVVHPQTPPVPSPRVISRNSTSGSLNNMAGSAASSPVGSPVFGPKRVLRNMTAVKQDVVMAGMWYRRAADKSHSRASNNLGELYMTGRGVPKDDVVGFNLFRRAALAGLPEAEYNLGRCYREGRGCTPNEDMAVSWFGKAEEKG